MPASFLNLSYLIASYPSDAAATPVTTGTASSWTAKTLNTAGVGVSSVTAYAICSP